MIMSKKTIVLLLLLAGILNWYACKKSEGGGQAMGASGVPKVEYDRSVDYPSLYKDVQLPAFKNVVDQKVTEKKGKDGELKGWIFNVETEEDINSFRTRVMENARAHNWQIAKEDYKPDDNLKVFSGSYSSLKHQYVVTASKQPKGNVKVNVFLLLR